MILFNLSGHGHFDLVGLRALPRRHARGLRVPGREGRRGAARSCRSSADAGGSALRRAAWRLKRRPPRARGRRMRSCLTLACWSCGRQIYTDAAARVAVRRGATLPALRRPDEPGPSRHRAARVRSGARTRRTIQARLAGERRSAACAAAARRGRRPPAGVIATCASRSSGLGLIGGSMARAPPRTPGWPVRAPGRRRRGPRAALAPPGVIDAARPARSKAPSGAPTSSSSRRRPSACLDLLAELAGPLATRSPRDASSRTSPAPRA